jgi:uncharacterized protein with PQ loop repeat
MELTSLVLTIAVVLANILGVGMLIPQTVHILRRGDLDGVSPEWIGMGVAVNVGWLIYAWVAGVWGIFGVSLGGLVLYLVMAAKTRRLDPAHFSRSTTTALLVLNVLGWAAAVGQVTALGLTLAALFTVQFAPAAWSAWTSPTVSGISATTWILALGEAGIWAGYGIAIGDTALLLGGSGASIMSGLVLLRLARGPMGHKRSAITTFPS